MILINLLCALFILHDPHADPDVCICAANRFEGGWCEKCDVGFCAGLRFTSRKLGEVIDFHGHQVNADRTACPECRKLIKSGGFCESCKMGFVGGRGFFSRICYQLARGKPVDNLRENGDKSVNDLDMGRKACCPADGWCDTCERGVVGNRLYDDKQDYELTRRAVAVLELAIEASARCDSCAGAMIADSRCPICRMSYKDGKPVESATTRVKASVKKPNADAEKPDSADDPD